MDQGLIPALKIYYWLIVVKNQHKLINTGLIKGTISVTILNAIFMLFKFWNPVYPDTVIDCFRKAETSKKTQTTRLKIWGTHLSCM